MTQIKKAETNFAPAERLENSEVYDQTIKILGLRQIFPILEIFPNIISIINLQRQVIYANKAFIETIGIQKFEETLGLRPGELLDCIHSHDNVNGCGTGKDCRYCEVVLTILKSQETRKKQENEALITINNNGKFLPLKFHVIVSPIEADNEAFYLLILTKVTNAKS